MLSRAGKQISILREWLEEIAGSVDANVHVRLWDGTIIPMKQPVTSPITVVVNSPDAIHRAIFAPELDTIVQLYVERLIDVEGGTLIDAARNWDHMSIVTYARSMSKSKLARRLWPFVFKSRMAVSPETGIDYRNAVESKPESGRNDRDLIKHHYDISNEFYALFLDREMLYSCAYFKTPDMSLEDAQQAKLDQICNKLRLQKGDRLLDIGCGWGGLACHAASEYGADVHAVTLSERQFTYASQKISAMGLQDQIKLELTDYRTIKPAGQYDRICQVEMFEHLGIDNHDEHFQRMYDLLRPRGLYFHQASTRMATRDLTRFRQPTPYQRFVTRYIFPGGELDHVGMTITNLERFRFDVHDVQGMREHFGITLEHWVNRLQGRKDEAIALVGEPRYRLWLFYMSMFCISFERNTVGLFQVVGSKRQVGPSGYPLARQV